MPESTGEIGWGWAGGRVGAAPLPHPQLQRPPFPLFCISWVWCFQVIPASLPTTANKVSIVLVSPGLGWPHPLTCPSGTSGEVILRVGWAAMISPGPGSWVLMRCVSVL